MVETQTFRKLCPVCKMSNDINAVTCRHCRTKFNIVSKLPRIHQVEDTFELTEKLKQQVVKEHTLPAKGVALFLLNQSEPIGLRTDKEFVLGRAEGSSSEEPIVDLSSFDALALGVSRRHVLVRSTGEKYVLMDLNSPNGTWLDGQQLVPTKLYDLPNGGVLQLGRLRLVMAYLKPVNPKK